MFATEACRNQFLPAAEYFEMQLQLELACLFI
jgi:hypothetical protein